MDGRLERHTSGADPGGERPLSQGPQETQEKGSGPISVRFGPAGQADNYRGKSSVKYPAWLAELGPDRASRFHSHFSKIAFTPNGGEKLHLTFDQEDFGPDPVPLMRELARRGWSPTIICESAGTQDVDALTMKGLYLACLAG